MPAKLQLSQDAEKNQQNLNMSVAATGRTAKNMTVNPTGNDPGKTITIPSESAWKKAAGIREAARANGPEKGLLPVI